MGLEVPKGRGMVVAICYPLLVTLPEHGHGPVPVSRTCPDTCTQGSRAALHPAAPIPPCCQPSGKGLRHPNPPPKR